VTLCIYRIPEDGNSGAETRRGDTYYQLCHIMCTVLLCAFVGQYIEYTRIHDMGNVIFIK
jgi:hypothetical protein